MVYVSEVKHLGLAFSISFCVNIGQLQSHSTSMKLAIKLLDCSFLVEVVIGVVVVIVVVVVVVIVVAAVVVAAVVVDVAVDDGQRKFFYVKKIMTF